MWQTIIHIVFILSAVGIAYVDKLSNGVTPHPAGHGHGKNSHGDHAH
jgi:uncharacterized membrane protein YqhA